MKKTFLAIAAAVMMSANMMAQDQQQTPQAPPQMDKEAMIKQRTEQVVKDYGMNEEQAGKLLALNTEFFDKMPMMGMGRGGFRGGQRGQRPQMGQGERPQGEHRQGDRPRMSREEMQKQMEAYNAELKKIMTEEQYAKYQEDQQKRMQRMRQGRPGGQRPQRPNND